MYEVNKDRYADMTYRRCGRSGLLLPQISFGLWQNFGLEKSIEDQRKILQTAFDLGVTHFDLANNYGFPAIGKAEENFGTIMEMDFKPYRDEMIISTKAGYEMWEGPYGNWGSRKYLVASLDQSLRRMGLDYVDIFYHHRPDPETPLEETAEALSHIVRQGKALYVGISNYKKEEAAQIIDLMKANKTPCLIHQPRYNMMERECEGGLFQLLGKEGVGCICFSPLAQGILTDRYIKGFQDIPKDSRAGRAGSSIQNRYFTQEIFDKITRLNQMAGDRGQSLAQMALAWILRNQEVTSVLIGASSTVQLRDNLAALKCLSFTQEELQKIDIILK